MADQDLSGTGGYVTDAPFEKTEIVGEIIEAGTTRFVAQCPRHRLHEPPVFGAFVKVLPKGARKALAETSAEENGFDDPFADPVAPAPGTLSGAPDDTLYALVCAASTGSSDLGRRPTAYGLEEAALREEQPQIFDLLATEFAALHIGYAEGGTVRNALPPRPPRLHAFVLPCSSEEVRALTETPDFARRLLQSSGEIPSDELVTASLRQGYEARNRDFAFLVRAGKQLASLLRDDPERLAALLRQLEPA